MGDKDLAITSFERVADFADSIYLDNARYYIGRSHYSLGSLDVAFGVFQSVIDDFPGATYEDNALFYQVRIRVDQVNCPAAATLLSRLETDYPGGTYTVQAADYSAANGC